MLNAAVTLGLLLRVIAGGALLFAGFAKLRLDAKTRAGIFRSYRLVPESLLAPVAWLLPIAEVLFGVALVSGALYPLSTSIAAVLLVAITGAVVISLLRRLRVKCGCFSSNRLVSWPLVIRNLGLIAVVVLINSTGLEGPGLRFLSIQTQLAALVAISLVVCLLALLTRSMTYKALTSSTFNLIDE